VRAEGSSKIAPHELDALLELGVALQQIFDVVRRRHGHILQTKLEIRQMPKLAAERKIPRAAASRRPERHILHEPLDRAGEQAIKR
jgi:hypothetical protein